jgi:hypothetical protein
MSTVSEIIEAVRELSPEQKLELVIQLESVVFVPEAKDGMATSPDYLSPEFTARLVEHFHRAKRAALNQS